MKAQIIERNGKPEYAVIPYADYEHLVSVAELVKDMRDYDKVKAHLARGEEEFMPAEMAHRLADGESPIRVWREHRGLTVSALAEQAAISQAYLSQIEAGKREGTIGVFHALAEALKVTIDDLVTD